MTSSFSSSFNSAGTLTPGWKIGVSVGYGLVFRELRLVSYSFLWRSSSCSETLTDTWDPSCSWFLPLVELKAAV